MEGTIKNLATVTKLDLTGDKDRGELLVDFGGTDIHRLIEHACKQIPGQESDQLLELSTRLLSGNHKLTTIGSLVINKKALHEWKAIKL